MSDRFPSIPHRQTFRKDAPNKCGPECGCQTEDAITTEIDPKDAE